MILKRSFLHLLALLLYSKLLLATHNRAGEITYRQLDGYRFEVTIITYTYSKSTANHYRDSLPIRWGDGTSNYIHRIKTPEMLPDDYQKNTYRSIHTYSGPGVYQMEMEDPNRNDGIRNIPESVLTPFAITTSLRIAADGRGNNTPQLLNPPIDKAAKGKRFIHNPAAFDSDGDSLSYRLTVCAGENGLPIQGYSLPPSSKMFYVDSIKGDLVWDAPTEIGNYNVAMIIEEWRNNIKIGKIVRDMQIEVRDTKNSPPILNVQQQFCIRCGDTLRFSVSATDADNDIIDLQASGGPLLLQPNEAQFPFASAAGTVSSRFTWVPQCDRVRQQPYIMVFKARDNNNETALTDEKQVNIQVLGHPPLPSAIQAGLNSFALQWNAAKSSPAQSFELYRSTQATSYLPDSCSTGIPTWLGYSKIADSLITTSTTFIDNDSLRNLSQGYTYCYRMLSRFADGAVSYASPEICSSLQGKLPTLTHVSVQQTDIANGSMLVRWSPPYSIDTAIYKRPWNYVVLRAANDSEALMPIARIANWSDTMFVDTMLNTAQRNYRYAIQFEASASQTLHNIGSTPASHNVFVNAIPSDRMVTLHFKTQTTWTNTRYVVFRQSPGGRFDSIGQCLNPTYIDTTVQNLQTYSYYIISVGAYSDNKIPHPLRNRSQTISVIPLDTIAPAPLSFASIEHHCDSLETIFRWQNLNRSMPQAGVIRYRLYYAPCQSGTMHIIYESNSSADTVYVHRFADTARSMSGCYAITALDAAGNESLRTHDSCFYACQLYSLPNVFTPNADGENDLFIPIKNKFVDSVNLSMYDRWGGLVFRTSTPSINWDGSNGFTHRPLTDGVFYYVCDVYERWLDCKSHPRGIVGFVHKFSDGKLNNGKEK